MLAFSGGLSSRSLILSVYVYDPTSLILRDQHGLPGAAVSLSLTQISLTGV